MTILILLGFATLVLYALAFVMLSFCAPRLPYVPSGDGRIQKMVALSAISPGDRVADLGSGDGRLVIAFAHAGAIVDGYEINPLLVWWSRRKIKALHLQDRATIHQKNFFHADLSNYDVLALYGISTIMRQLERYIRPLLKKGGRVIVNSTVFPDWKPTVEDGGVRVYSV